MSRCLLAPLPELGDVAQVAVGWDRPLRTFYVQVFGPPDDDGEDSVIVWVGTAPGELATVAEALALVRAYAVIPDDLAGRLEADRRDGYDQRDGPAQRRARRFLVRPSRAGREGGS